MALRFSILGFLQHLNKTTDNFNVSVFVLTTSNSREDQSAAMREDVAGYIVKSEMREGLAKIFKVWQEKP